MARFTNQAQLRYGNAVANSNIAVGEIMEVLSATKTAVNNTYGQNDNVTYVISIVNSGAVPFSGITVTDNLGEYNFGTETLTPLTYIPGTVKFYANGVLQPAPTVAAVSPLTVTGLTVPAGGNATVIYEAEVNSFAPMETGSQITNTAVVSATGITPVTVSETILVEEAPILSITKSVSPVPVTENGTLTYTFLIQNMGNTAADATAGVVVLDTFPRFSAISPLPLTEPAGQKGHSIRMMKQAVPSAVLQAGLRFLQPPIPRIRQAVHG